MSHLETITRGKPDFKKIESPYENEVIAVVPGVDVVGAATSENSNSR